MLLNDLRILLVEDNTQTRNLMRALLKDMGVYQVFEAPDGRKAQKFLDDCVEEVHLIVCDWQMPEMTGLALLQQVRMTMDNIPFLMVTATSDIASVKQARDLGVNAYILKPFVAEEFQKKISALAVQIEE